MGNFGIQEIVIIVVIIALLFGSSRLPGIARGTGKHLRKTKDSVGTFKDEFESGMREIDPRVSDQGDDEERRDRQGDHRRRRPRIPRPNSA